MQRIPQAISGLIKVGALPDQDELSRLLMTGRTNLINVAGVSLKDIYGHDLLSALTISEYFFSDVFSELVEPRPDGSRTDYLEIATAEHRHQFSLATAQLSIAISQMTSTYVFCRQGVGRAPAVALAALHSLIGGEISVTCDLVGALRPQAAITRTTISAAHWYAERSALAQ